MNKMTECKFCKCSPVCKHKEQWSKYCEEHISLRKESVLFDGEPVCRYYIEDKSLINMEKQRETESRISSDKNFYKEDMLENPYIKLKFMDDKYKDSIELLRALNKSIYEALGVKEECLRMDKSLQPEIKIIPYDDTVVRSRMSDEQPKYIPYRNTDDLVKSIEALFR